MILTISINDFMIYCTNKDLTKKTMKSYEGTLKLFAKYLADEVNVFTPLDVTTKNIKDYLEYYKNKRKIFICCRCQFMKV
ncbi:phage integrase N-terminal SAM-like domain-containing protein [Clostridium butyricum]|uniref:phage integrase N-terminal SAM-like domain-containing protein n=1 Tax=Clostridium butyricum TaxID=1492 RepID=UPI002ABEA174|nr:phage integrase N-terminal SAM-like domain-containing protein [Clostridium butyricum]